MDNWILSGQCPRDLSPKVPSNNITPHLINTNLILPRPKKNKVCGQSLKFQNVKCRTCGITDWALERSLNVTYLHSILAGIPPGNFEKNLKIAVPGDENKVT